MRWHWIALAYVLYLGLVSLTRREFAAVRGALLTAGVIVAGLTATLESLNQPLGHVWMVILPALVLLAGYRLSGLLFARVDQRAEKWLQATDDRLLRRTGILAWFARAPLIVIEYFELCYLLVYPALPLGSTILAVSGSVSTVDDYWTTVLLAEFICFAVLPWVQTRPPMLLEAVASAHRGPIRRFNQLIAARASIRANTIPSGHAAGALASALVVASHLPVAGAIFLVLALSIATASVLGRYHYALDSVLGLLVAVAAWWLLLR